MNIKSFLKFNSLIILLGTLLVPFFSSCLGMKGSGGKSGKSLFITFYTEDKSTQYFIKPLKFENKNKESIICDFTFKNSESKTDSATMNISIITKDLLKSIDSLVLINANSRIVLKNNQFLFNERTKELINSRYSYKISFSDLQKLFADNNWRISYFSNKNTKEFLSSKKTKAKLDKLSYEIFSLF